MKKLILTCAIVCAAIMSLLVPAAPVAAQSGGGGCNTESRFLTFPTWWRGLEIDQSTCSVKLGEKLERDLAKIAVNVVEIILQIVGYACVIYIIVGGFYYLTSMGVAEGQVRGRKTIQNAIIGLIISLMSVGIVNLVASGLGS
ncbi:MAG: hypothetical protein Q4B06_04170 [Candidatus Saccharibacteria bacterium]|nr:hypothetical protein [Candidatus Saccharibacteria bacterium]